MSFLNAFLITRTVRFGLVAAVLTSFIAGPSGAAAPVMPHSPSAARVEREALASASLWALRRPAYAATVVLLAAHLSGLPAFSARQERDVPADRPGPMQVFDSPDIATRLSAATNDFEVFLTQKMTQALDRLPAQPYPVYILWSDWLETGAARVSRILEISGRTRALVLILNRKAWSRDKLTQRRSMDDFIAGVARHEWFHLATLWYHTDHLPDLCADLATQARASGATLIPTENALMAAAREAVVPLEEIEADRDRAVALTFSPDIQADARRYQLENQFRYESARAKVIDLFRFPSESSKKQFTRWLDHRLKAEAESLPPLSSGKSSRLLPRAA